MNCITHSTTKPPFWAQRGISLVFSLLLSLLLLLASLLSPSASAQVAVGTPPFGSFSGGPDVINLGNNNSHWTIPVLHKPGRGPDFRFDLGYDTSVWYPVGSSGNQTWQQIGNWGWVYETPVQNGAISYQLVATFQIPCNPPTNTNPQTVYSYANWAFTDMFGTRHPFTIATDYYPSGCPYQPYATSGSQLAPDGSGYTLNVTLSTNGSVTDSRGSLISSSFTDRNGNQITADTNGHFYDTLSSSTPVLTASGAAPSNTTFAYTAPSGASASFTMSYVYYTVATNFAVSGIGEYGAHAVYLVDKVTLPDNTFYQFTYEATPSTPSNGACSPLPGTSQTNCVTARLAKVTLPTGGYIAYSYSGGAGTNGSGIFADGSAATVQRTVNDGTTSNTWTYVRSQVSGNEWQTKITTPPDPGNSPPTLGNDTVIYFQKDSGTSNGTNNSNNFYETQRVVYQGASSSNNVLRTLTTCYNGNTTNCTTTAVSSPITQRNVTDQYGSSGLQCRHKYFYNGVGGLTEQDDYDYGSGGPGGLLRQTLVTYASLPPHITAFRQTVTVKNGSGTVVSQTNYNYDENTPGSTSSWGITQHTSVSGSRGNLTSINYPVSGITSHSTYYDTGVPNTSQDVNGATTTYNYGTSTAANCNGAFPTSISEPLSMSRSMAWNCTGGVMTSLTDENSQVTSTTYSDAYFWRPANVNFPDGGQTSWTYNSPTSLTTTTKMNSSQNITSTVLLDGLSRSSQTKLNSDTQGVDYGAMTYDALGRPYQAYNPTRCSPPTTNCGEATWGYTTTRYDALNRVTQVTLQDGSVATASYTNNTVTATDPAGKTRQSTLDALGRVTQVVEDPGTSPHLNYVTSYTFDALSNLTNVTQNGGRTRNYIFDAMSRLTSETNPESGTVTYGYDANGYAGDLTSRVAPAPNQTGSATVTTTYTYDLLHRLKTKSYSDGTTPSVQYTYDVVNQPSPIPQGYDVGRLTATWTSGKGTKYSHDKMGRIAYLLDCVEPTACNNSLVGSYQFDLAGNITQASYQMWNWNGTSYTATTSPLTFNQIFDTAARPTQLTSNLVDSQHPGTLATVDSGVGYYPYGAIRKMTFGNNLTQAMSIEARLQPCRINLNSSNSYVTDGCNDGSINGTVQDFFYAFGSWGSTNNDSVTTMNAAGAQAFNRAFTYDSLNRIATMQETSGIAESCKPSSSPTNPYTISWTIDPWGNRTAQSPNAGTCSFSQGVNTLNQLSGSPYQYDAAGNMTHDASHGYAYDAENRLIQVDGGSTATYAYDPNGRRVTKTIGSTITNYAYDLAQNVLFETQGTNWSTAYIYFAGALTAEYSNNTTYFLHGDHLGSTRLLTGVNQSVAQNLDYLPFGEILSSDSGITTHKFTGDERNSETSLDQAWFRQYSSELGRWMHPDPAGLAAVDPSNPQSWNRYAYVLNNPLALIDPLGLYCVLNGQTVDDDFEECESDGGTWVVGGMGPSSGLGGSDPGLGLGFLGLGGDTGSSLDLPLFFMMIEVWGTNVFDTAGINGGNSSWWGAFFSDLFSWQSAKQAQVDAWNKGYYKCLGKKTAGGATAPLVTHAVGVAATNAAESGASTIAGAYFHFTDGRFTAWGKYSQVLVRNLAPKIATAAKVLDVAGWAYFDYELANAINECSEVLH